ncbi:UNVERIFIED_CONTAM: hypothetical protein GTU68_039528 [Idotea baltica]|nr:hypothetical protein [Idotea baltica]
MSEIARKVAQYLLQIKAVELSPSFPFTWVSGIKSPIYCDNRKILSHPSVRNYIIESFCELVDNQYSHANVIAGVATAGIAHAALIAWRENLPMIYVRSKAKEHGMQNLIEGVIDEGQKVVVVEDLISTGKSTLAAVAALRAKNVEVLGAVAIFSYGFKETQERFAAADCPFQTLSHYDVLVEEALKHGYVEESTMKTLKEWNANPKAWKGVKN